MYTMAGVAMVLNRKELWLPCNVMFGFHDEDSVKIEDYVDELQFFSYILELLRENIDLATDIIETRYPIRSKFNLRNITKTNADCLYTILKRINATGLYFIESSK